MLTCLQDEVWTHSDGTANFDVIDARNYSAVREDVIAHVNISGHGKLVFDPGTFHLFAAVF